MPFFNDSAIPMSDEEFRLLRDHIYSYSGLYFSSDAQYLLEKRLGRRLQEQQFKSFREYYQFLKFNRKRDQELEEIMDILTTNETYFFRESYQLQAFSDEILPELIKKARTSAVQRPRLRIWSAGCSTGEEPYTIAMLLLEQAELAHWQIEVVGTDISQRVLQQARRGVYAQASFRMTDEYYLRKYFTRQDDGQRINDQVRQLVSISHLNLQDQARMAMLGAFDIIFCRNVLIYFDIAAKKRVVEAFYNSLRPEGYLLLGHSESLMNVTTLYTLRHFKNDMVYQKPAASANGVQA